MRTCCKYTALTGLRRPSPKSVIIGKIFVRILKGVAKYQKLYRTAR
ncbi:Uncharacterized protein dnm_051610 [Desulfonema magnum]|uniref:Uncharacterized protein n=1 Tax=Desulfonema magnum TaxID=45655 RepID=A0A975GQM7_9BACT|nr:Uncharacterized protein dnm_051610 [Desulfonema magnum]